MFTFRGKLTWVWKQELLMQILVLLSMYFDVVVVEVHAFLLLFRLTGM